MTVDIIIPCYYSSDIIKLCLNSVVQQTVIKDITVILVNDCSPNTDCNYTDIVNEFKDKCRLFYYKLPYHGGPGAARQFGLDRATSDWVMFIDDDDELYDNTAVERLLKQADIDHVVSVTGQSVEVNLIDQIIDIHDPWIHHHGSIYNRKILEEKNIHYDRRLIFDEDGAFSRMILHQTQGYKKIKLYEKIYKKKINRNSLTSQQNIETDHMISLIGLATLDLQYRHDAEVQENIAQVADDLAIVKNLLYFLAIDSTIQLTHKQYSIVFSFIIQFNTLLIQKDYKKLKPEDYQQSIDFQNSHFKFYNNVYSYYPIKIYEQCYLEWLMAIFIKLKPE